MIYDTFTYNGEQDILEIRLNVLNDSVDQFIIIEAKTTFSGLVKPLYYEQHKARFAKFHNKIKYFVIDENYSGQEIALAKSSPNTQGAEHWTREFLQKESIKKALTHLSDDDVCFIGDCDEIWEMPYLPLGRLWKLRLRVYTYYLNNRSSEHFAGTLYGRWGDIRGFCLNEIRTQAPKTTEYYGSHFTSMGGYEEVKRKLNDSYTHETYNSQWVRDNLDGNIKNRKDFLGRRIDFWKDETDWPQYLKDHKALYQHLCLP